jgi:co-chaperonin GroES (HSP10)
MKAIGRNLVVKIAKTGISKTQGGLLLGEKQREDIRYAEGTVVTAGADAGGLKKNDVIYFDKNNSHQIEVKDEIYNVVKVDNVVIVL